MNMMRVIRIVPFLFVSSALYRPDTLYCRTMALVSYHGILTISREPKSVTSSRCLRTFTQRKQIRAQALMTANSRSPHAVPIRRTPARRHNGQSHSTIVSLSKPQPLHRGDHLLPLRLKTLRETSIRAACHGCLLISETSCEQQNDFLDRSLVVPTVQNLGAELFTENIANEGSSALPIAD